MKKAFTQTIIVFVAVNLITAGFAFAQNAPDEASREEAIAARKQMEAAQKEAEVAQKQMEIAQKEMETQEKKLQAQLKQLLVAQTQAKTDYEDEYMMEEMMMEPPVAPRVSIPVWPRSGSGAVLVIPAAQMKVEDLAAITTDMSIMSRIFDKKLSQARLTTRGSWSWPGFDPLAALGRSSGAIEAIYLEGYGALFLMKVNVLLSAPPETQQEKETEEEDTDPLWTETIQEMYAPPEVNRRRRTDRPEEKYDAEKVEDLKETLIKTLKHAANIRALKPDESVILTVIGKAGQSAGVTIKAINRRGEYLILDKDKRTTSIVKAPSLSDIGFYSPTFLVIRAKKSDIDAFAKGQLSFDQFHQKTQLISHPFLGRNLGGQPSRFSPMR